jgi:hypothetical protein
LEEIGDLARENVWHTLKVEEVLEKLGRSVSGLTSAEAEKWLIE